MSLHLNIETNRSFWHKDEPLIGFIWVHLLSGRRGTHPSDPSLFTYPPLHSHVPLCHPPTCMIPTQPCLIMAGIIMTTATMAALETTECVGHRDSLSTYETAGWKKTNNFECFSSGSFCIKMWAIFAQRNSASAVFLRRSLKTLHLEESGGCLVTKIQLKWDSHVQQQQQGGDVKLCAAQTARNQLFQLYPANHSFAWKCFFICCSHYLLSLSAKDCFCAIHWITAHWVSWGMKYKYIYL